MLTKGLLYFNLSCWDVDQMDSLLRSKLLRCRPKGFSTLIQTVEMLIRGLLYFDLNYWNVNQRASLLQSELLRCWLKGFSTLIRTVAYKSQNFELDFKWWGLCCSLVFEMCDFHLSLLDFIFNKKTSLDFCSSLKKILFLKLEAWNWKL